MGQPHISHILNNTVLYIKYFVKRVNLMLGVLITIKGGGGVRKGGREEGRKEGNGAQQNPVLHCWKSLKLFVPS